MHHETRRVALLTLLICALSLPTSSDAGPAEPALRLPGMVAPKPKPKSRKWAFNTGFVLLASPTLPDAESLRKAAAGFGLPRLVMRKSKPQKTKGKRLKEIRIFDMPGGRSLSVLLLRAPYPLQKGNLSGPRAPHPSAVNKSKAHLLVLLRDRLATNGKERVQTDMILMRCLAAVTKVTPSVAAIASWGNVLKRPELIQKSVVGSGGMGAALIDITLARNPPGRISALTHGMARYGREELLVTAKPNRTGDAYGWALMTAAWLLHDLNKVLPTGDTIGRSAQEKVKVKRSPNPLGKGPPVIRLDL